MGFFALDMDTSGFIAFLSEIKDIAFPIVLAVVGAIALFLFIKIAWRIIQASANGDAEGRAQAFKDCAWMIVGFAICCGAAIIVGVVWAMLPGAPAA